MKPWGNCRLAANKEENLKKREGALSHELERLNKMNA